MSQQINKSSLLALAFAFGGGPNDDGFRYPLNVPPVVPFQMTENWNLISPTIVPFLFPK